MRSWLLIGMMISLYAKSVDAAEWDQDVTVLSNYIYRGFSYSNEQPVVQGSVGLEAGKVYTSMQVTPVQAGSTERMEVKLETTRDWLWRENLVIHSSIAGTYGGFLSRSHELGAGFTYQRGKGWLRSHAYAAVDQPGSRHVDIEIGWHLNEYQDLSMAWGNTRKFVYLANDDHDYYKFQWRYKNTRGHWMVAFERAYDTGDVRPLSNERRLVVGYTWRSDS